MLIKLDKVAEFYDQIIDALRNSEVVALPTDTVYGLAVDGTDTRAVNKLNEIKKRSGKPFTFFIAKGEIKHYAQITKRRIIDFFIPGPITVILKKKKGVSFPFIDDKIGIRLPQSEFIINFLNTYKKPLAVTSVNISGQPTLTSPYEIIENFTQVPLVIDGGTIYSHPSTVIDLTTTPPTIRRKGLIPILQIEKVYGRKVMIDSQLKFNVLFVCSGNSCRSPMAEGILKTLIDNKYCEIKSAGTISMGGLPAAPFAIQVVKEYGGSIEQHQTRYLDRELIDWADLILTMEFKHYDAVLEILPDAAIKTFLLREYKHKTRYNEIEDPIGREIDAYKKAARKMYPALKSVAEDIIKRFQKDLVVK